MRSSVFSVTTTLVVALCGLPLAAALRANESPPAVHSDAPETIELTVAKAREPRPALKYRLLPVPSERTPGNAATYYYRAIVQQKMLPPDYWKQHADRSEAWLTKDAAKYPKDEVEKWLATQAAVLAQLKIAVYRERCDWDLRIGDLRGMEVISFLLAEFQELRTLASTLQLQAHHQIMTGREEDALETLSRGYQLAQDAGRPPFLIGGLIGIAITNMMNQELTFLIEHSSHNYYWALAALPERLIDLRPAMQMEMNMPRQIFPFLQDAETSTRSPEEWRRLIVECMRGLEALGGAREYNDWQAELLAAALAAKFYSTAKNELIAAGLEREKVEAMPVGQVIAIQTARGTDYAFQEIFKTSLLPYHQASRRLTETENRLIQEGYLGPGFRTLQGIPIANLLLPAVAKVVQAETRAARDMAALRAIEALRMHAAASGELPASLADVSIVPVPVNPATGEPFHYQLDSATGAATLDLPALGDGRNARRYVIKLKK